VGCAWFFEERRGRPFTKVIKSAFLYIKDYLIETNAVFHLKELEKMSDKKMLNEAAIRKMMKLANIPALTDKFIKENYFEYNEEMAYQRDDEEPEMPMDDAPVDEPEMDLDAEVDIEEPAGEELPAAEELVQDLMGVLEKHFDEVEFNVDVEGEDDEPAMDMDAEPEMDLEEPAPEEPMDDAPMGDEPSAMDDEEEEPMMETDLEEGDSQAATDLPYTQSSDEEGAAAEVAADEAFMEEETLGEEEELEEMEDADAHSKLIDAIAAKVAERLLAEAKKTNE